MHKRSSRKIVHSSKAKVQDVLLLAMISVRARHVAFGHSQLRTKDNAGTKQHLDRVGSVEKLSSKLGEHAEGSRAAVAAAAQHGGNAFFY